MMARQELANYDNWKLVARHKDLGLTIRERKMSDGGRLIIAVDDMARYTDGQVTGFPYRDCFSVRIGPNGERVGRDGSVTTPDWMKRWYSTGGSIECYIATDRKYGSYGAGFAALAILVSFLLHLFSEVM